MCYTAFLTNPYDNQRRGALMCNAILDSQVYNGHTTAGDALWGGVPIITMGVDVEMSGRVGMSALTALGLPELIVYSPEEYYSLAVSLGRNSSKYRRLRTRLVDTTTARPRNPFWDLRRYYSAGVTTIVHTIDGLYFLYTYVFSVCVCLCIYVYVYICICMFVYIYMYICIYVYIYVNVQLYTCICVGMFDLWRTATSRYGGGSWTGGLPPTCGLRTPWGNPPTVSRGPG